MSSDSRPSFRLSAKKKFQQLLPSNLTSSIRDRFISNETYQDLSAKSRNLTKTIIDNTGLDTVINKTKTFIPSKSPSNENIISPKGFFDSLFYPQTINEFYLKVTIICLWIVAMFCIIATIITMFVSIKNNDKQKNNSTRWIFLHIFLCELCYLIYILLSMINVGLDFQLNSFWCDIGKYFMYATVPVMYFVLVILFFERIATYCKLSSGGKLKSSVFIQFLIVIIWIVAIVLISLFIYFKNRTKISIKSIPEKFLPDKFKFSVSEIIDPDKCSIDGQLLPIFKIIFLILLIIIIVLFIKSMILSFVYTFFTLSCFQSKNKGKKSANDYMTLIFILILFFNLALSFPFYFISTASSIVNTFREEQSFTMKLKISFILRLISIILQCFVFYTLENGCWTVLQKIIGCIRCQRNNQDKQHIVKKNGRSYIQSDDSSSLEEQLQPNKLTKKVANVDKTDDSSDETSSDEKEEDDDDVFTDDPEHASSNLHQSKTTESTSTSTDESNSDDNQKKSKAKKKDILNQSLSKQHQSIKDKSMIKETKSKISEMNGLSKKTTSNGKVTSPQKSSTTTTTDKKSLKLSQIPKHESTSSSTSSSSSDSSLDSIVNNTNENSHNKIQSTIVESKPQPIPHPPSYRIQSPRRYRGRQRHWTSRTRFSQSIRSTSINHKYIKLSTDQPKPTETINNHSEKSKDHSKRMHFYSTPV